MFKLALILTHKYRLLSVAAALDVFETANQFFEELHGEPFFIIDLYESGGFCNASTFPGYVPKNITDLTKTDLVLIPAFSSFDLQAAVEENKIFIPWIHHQYAQGAEIGSFCTGAFLLAASGLLDKKKATTHINATSYFLKFFPSVYLQPEAVLTHDQGLYTSGGATSSFHLMLYIIEKNCGRELAIRIAKLFAIDIDRDRQLYFGSFIPVQSHGDEMVLLVQQEIERAYPNSCTIEEIVQKIPASRRNMERRFKQATGITPIEYLQKTRIEAAKKLLEQTNQTVLQVMLNTGYNDLKSFRQLFKKSVGMVPKDYRDKFRSRRSQELLSV